MVDTIQLKRSAVPGMAPTSSQLTPGELAINTYDGTLFLKKDDGTESVVQIGSTALGNASQETILSVSVDTTLSTNYTFINAINTITLTLPTIGVADGFRIHIRNAGVGQITLVGTINGMANITLGETNSVIGLMYTSSGWVIF